jgi:hypothetical protein
MGIKEFLVPQDRAFFDLLSAEADNAVVGADALVALVKDYKNVGEARRSLKDIEHKGDQIVHDIYEELNRTFITPIDREDITRIASSVDDVLDFTYATANHLYLFEIKESNPRLVKLAEILAAQSRHLAIAVKEIRNIKNRGTIRTALIEINRLENDADEVTNEAIADLFHHDDVKHIIKMRTIYEYLEQATDKCEDAADVISDLLVKNA